MTIVADTPAHVDALEVTVGVDTHADTHVARPHAVRRFAGDLEQAEVAMYRAAWRDASYLTDTGFSSRGPFAVLIPSEERP